MADQEDGSDFISIDDNAVSDGTSDANTRPEDTMLENIVDSDHRYLFERGACVVKRWWSSNEIDNFRPFASDVGEACIAAIPWEIRNGVKTITAKLHGRVDCDGPNTDPDLRVKLEFYSGTDNDDSITTNVTTVGRQVITLTLPFTGEDVAQTRGYLLVWIKSEADEVINTDQVDTQGVGTSGNDWLAELDSTSNLEANLDERTNFKSIGPDEQQRKLFHKSNTVTDGTKITGLAPEYSVLASGQSAELAELSYIRPEKLAIRQTYDTTQGIGINATYSPKPPREMEPQRAVKGADVSEHPRNADAIARRPKCLAVGPIGEDDWDDTPADYHQQFVWDMDPDTDTPTLDSQGIQLNYDDSRLRCMAMIKGAFEESTKSTAVAQTAYPTDGPGGNSPSKSEYRNERATADMDLRLRIRQSDGTAWSNNTGVDIRKTFEKRSLHRVRPQAHFDLMNTWYWALFPQTGGNQPSSDFRWAFQEGTFSRPDLSLVGPQPLQITIDTSDLSFSRALPIRVDLEFAGWSSGPNTSNVELRGDGNSQVSFGVVCMGTSYWELPPV